MVNLMLATVLALAIIMPTGISDDFIDDRISSTDDDCDDTGVGLNTIPDIQPHSAINTYPSTYDVVDVGTLGGDETFVHAINDLNQIAGGSRNENGEWRLFLWEDGEMTDLGADLVGPEDMNNNGLIVGWYDWRAKCWYNGELYDLGTFGGHYSWASAVNDDGIIVGWAENESLVRHAALGNISGWQIDIGSNWPMESYATGINEDGVVCGYVRTGYNNFTSFLWDNGEITILWEPSLDEQYYARDINDEYSIVGDLYHDWDPPWPHTDGWIWNPDTGGHLLPELTGYGEVDYTEVVANNNAGTIVGQTCVYDVEDSLYGTLWENDTAYALNDLLDPGSSGYHIKKSIDINNNDWILIEAYDHYYDGLVLVPHTPGDIDYDGDVDSSDLLILLAYWGTSYAPADINGDGVVNTADLLILLGNWTG